MQRGKTGLADVGQPGAFHLKPGPRRQFPDFVERVFSVVAFVRADIYRDIQSGVDVSAEKEREPVSEGGDVGGGEGESAAGFENAGELLHGGQRRADKVFESFVEHYGVERGVRERKRALSQIDLGDGDAERGEKVERWRANIWLKLFAGVFVGCGDIPTDFAAEGGKVSGRRAGVEEFGAGRGWRSDEPQREHVSFPVSGKELLVLSARELCGQPVRGFFKYGFIQFGHGLFSVPAA